MKQCKNEMGKNSDSLYFCPLCMRMQEFAVPCCEMFDEKFVTAIMLEFREINEEEVRDERAEILRKNQMKLSDEALESLK